MAKIVWRERALADISRLYEFIYTKDSQAAGKVAQTILKASQLLASTPRLGRRMPDETRRRELFIPFGSRFYVIRYFLDDNETIVIVRVWHSREDRS